MSLKSTNQGRRHFLKQSVAVSSGLLLPGWVIAEDVPKTAKSNNATSGDDFRIVVLMRGRLIVGYLLRT